MTFAMSKELQFLAEHGLYVKLTRMHKYAPLPRVASVDFAAKNLWRSAAEEIH